MNLFEELGIPIWFVAKLFVLFGLGVYMVFAYVVLKQVRLMNETLEIGFEKSIKIMAQTHLILAALVFLLSIFIL